MTSSSWTTEHSRLTTGLLIAAAIILAALALWKLPKWQAARSQGISSKNRFDREDQARKTLAQVIGGIFVLAGLYSSVQTFNLQQEGQITDRYTKAIDQLGALLPGDKGDANGKPQPNLEVRLGGIYALERIAHDSPRDQGTIMEVLSAYVRDNSPVAPEADRSEASKAEKSSGPSKSPSSAAPDKPRADIQAILTVIGRRDVSNDPKNFVLGLSNTNLTGANLIGANLHYADLSLAHLIGADLPGANLRGAHLRGANLRGANLRGANLRGANLYGADLLGANLIRAHLYGANLIGANLIRAHLHGADLRGAELIKAHLSEADLLWADLSEANLSEANLSEANLSEANLNGAFGLKQEQVDQACGDKGTVPPPNLHPPPSCR